LNAVTRALQLLQYSVFRRSADIFHVDRAPYIPQTGAAGNSTNAINWRPVNDFERKPSERKIVSRRPGNDGDVFRRQRDTLVDVFDSLFRTFRSLEERTLMAADV